MILFKVTNILRVRERPSQFVKLINNKIIKLKKKKKNPSSICVFQFSAERKCSCGGHRHISFITYSVHVSQWPPIRVIDNYILFCSIVLPLNRIRKTRWYVLCVVFESKYIMHFFML